VKIGITFGAMAPKLHEQLGLPRRRLRYLQECADGIVSLAVGGMLSDAETHRARRRLMKRILTTFGKEIAAAQRSVAG
jgi:3-methyladenine DNA glycosylase/8-oxoguanine DNA glycosylase